MKLFNNEVGKALKEDRLNAMLTQPPWQLVVRLGLPTIVSMLISSFYNMADSFFIGMINTSASGAVGIIFSLMTVIQAFGFMFGHGSGNYISRQLGAREYKSASVMAAFGFFTSLIFGVLFSAVCLIFLDPLVRLLGSTETILPYAKDYAFWIAIGSPFMISSLVLNNQLRFQGNSFFGMIAVTAGGVLNIGLDPLFIFTFNMGIGGAALATIISQLVSFMLLYFGCKKSSNVEIKLSSYKFSFKLLKTLISGGLPSLGRQGITSVSNIILNLAAGPYGDAAIAAMSIVTRITSFSVSALLGFNQGFQPVCGINYGAKQYARVREAFWFSVKVSGIALIVIGGLQFLFAPMLVPLFRKDDMTVIAIGIATLRFHCLTMPLNGFIMLCNMLFQTIGKTARAFLMAVARSGLFFIPALLILSPLFELTGLQISQPVADICSFLLAIPLSTYIFREMKEQELLYNLPEKRS